MANTSVSNAELASGILQACLETGEWSTEALGLLVDRAAGSDSGVAQEASRALFGIVVENLADLFESRLCDIYARLFATVIERLYPQYSAAALIRRYHSIHCSKPFTGEPQRVCVLSRVTLGADVAVTSVVLAAAKQRFPDAEICFVGPPKNGELFAGDEAIHVVPLPYGRSGQLLDRLRAAEQLRQITDRPGTLVIDPDSRLTQLGLMPVCSDDAYLFFESRGFQSDSHEPLPVLTARWLQQVLPGLNEKELRSFSAPAPQTALAPVTVSLGVGENPAKRLDDAFELALLRELTAFGVPVLIDRGAGGEEAERVDRLCKQFSREQVLVHEGSFASFASHILQSDLYAGYDSAGQHVAAAAGIPLISIFSGYVSERMKQRWTPAGPGPMAVIDAKQQDTAAVLAEVSKAIRAFRKPG